MKEGKGSGGNLFDDGAETNSENWTVYQMIRHQSCSPYLVACCRSKKYVEIRLNPGLTSMIFTTWPGHPVATTFSLAGRNSNSERWKIYIYKVLRRGSYNYNLLSVDNTAIVTQVHKNKKVRQVKWENV